MHHKEFAFERRCVVFYAQHSTSRLRQSLCVTSWVPLKSSDSLREQEGLDVCVILHCVVHQALTALE